MPPIVARAVLILLLLPASLAAGQPQTVVVRGRVIGADGQAAAGAAVVLLDRLGYLVASTRCEANGRFQFDDVAPGTYVLRADAPSQRSEAHTVTVLAALPIEIDLHLAARADDRVVVGVAPGAPSVTTRTTIAGDALQQMPVRMSSRGVQQALATLPGFASEDNGILHVRGVDDGFLYVEDGVPVYDRLDAAFGIAPGLADIGSLHVITGYLPPEFGLKSGAVIEARSSTAPRDRWAGRAGLGGGSEALASGSAQAGGPLGKAITLGTSVAGERSDRFLDPVHPDNLHNQGGVASGAVRLGVAATTADLVRLSADIGRSRFQVPHGDLQEVAGQDQRQVLRQHAQSGSWQRAWSDVVVSQVAVYHRRIGADLRDTPAATPVFAASARRHDRLGLLASATLQRGRHTVKAGVEAARLALREDFTFAVTDHDAAEEADISDAASAFTSDDPFRFAGRVTRAQWSLYVQDRIRVTDRATVELGVRHDRTRQLVSASQWSPRAGVAYAWPRSATTVRASVNRLFQPPQPEHLLLSSSPEARALSPFATGAEDGTGGAVLAPERQVAIETGVEQWLGGLLRADVAFWSRHVRNYADPNVFLGTTIVFPNSVARGVARGLDVRVELPAYRGWSSYLSYTLSKVEQEGPINGGLFLEDDIADIGPGTRFTPDHDQRHVASAGVTYLPGGRRPVVSLAARYESGTPVEVDLDDVDELIERPGAERVSFDRGRVRPRVVVDLGLSQVVRRGARMEVSVRAGVLNALNRAYALNFGNPFSGTHFGAPRTVRLDVQLSTR